MDNGKIGIKVADGSFYPILDEGIAQKKRLVLTTVKDNQESVQIDLYKGRGEEMEDAAYVGSLLIENISPDTQGNAEVELVVGVDEEGNLESIAEDKRSGARQSLSVGLKDLDESGLYDVPDFSVEEDTDFENIFDEEAEEEAEDELDELDELSDELPEESNFTEFLEPGMENFELDELSDQDLSEDLSEDASKQEFEFEEVEDMFPSEEQLGAEFGDELETDDFSEDEFPESEFPEEDQPDEEFVEEPQEEKEEESGSKARPILVALLVILAIGLLGALLYLFVFMTGDEEETPLLQSQQEQSQEQDQEQALEQTQEQTDQAVAEAAPEEEPQAPADSQPAAETEDEVVVSPSRDEVEFTGGVWYKIRWGDTLWQISSSFYDNPRLYDKIAEENEIRNPDLIYAENSIFIPKTD